jgi:hypothetical protein
MFSKQSVRLAYIERIELFNLGITEFSIFEEVLGNEIIIIKGTGLNLTLLIVE